MRDADVIRAADEAGLAMVVHRAPPLPALTRAAGTRAGAQADPHRQDAPMTDTHSLNRRDARRAAGKRLRERVSRESLSEWQPAPGRDPLAILKADEAGRLLELIPERRKRMRETPFAFLRGAAAVMAADLEGASVPGLPVQACGDCHIGNFGVYRSPRVRPVRHQRFRRDALERRFHCGREAPRRQRGARGLGPG